ncbi:class I SAM-dependent methyltransferase [soil metagenome]
MGRMSTVAIAMGLTVSMAAIGLAAIAADKPAAKAPTYAAAAVADKARPKADTDRDVHRKPVEMLVYAGINPGSTVAELIPGGGYFTRVFGKAVAPKGHVYALINAGRAGAAPPAVKSIAADPTYAGVITVIEGDLTQAKTPSPVDVVWTSQNYHDLNATIRKGINKAAFDMLKPGGTYIVLDHSAILGTGDYAMATPATALHRIDENLVKLEVLSAGFKLVGESDVLRNASDTRLTRVFDSQIRGDTDQFVLKFQKPK